MLAGGLHHYGTERVRSRMRLELADTTNYCAAFYEAIEPGATTSAEVIVPLTMQLLEPRSVLDVGCGRGVWLKAFQRAGVRILKGIDGPHVERDDLLIGPEQFVAMDLRNPAPVDGHFDLAVCLEVAEHLPPSAGTGLVKLLTQAAPVVLFAAAIPGQGGTGHINERWPEYWRRLFAEDGYQLTDPIRPYVWSNQRVEWWYRQNMVMFCSPAVLEIRQHLKRHLCSDTDPVLEWVHRGMIRSDAMGSPSGRELCRMLLRRVWRRVAPRNEMFTAGE